jgi:hypothetical protein
MGQMQSVPIHVARVAADVGYEKHGVPDGHELVF